MADDRPFAREVADRQVAMFQMFVGHGRPRSWAALVAASGYSESTLRGYAAGTAMPMSALLALAQCLPPAAINMLTEPGGKMLIDLERSATNWDALAARLCGLASEICDARSDGQIDHRENATLRQHARELAAHVNDAAEGQ